MSQATQTTPTMQLCDVAVQVEASPAIHRSVQTVAVQSDAQSVQTSMGRGAKFDNIETCHLCFKVHEKDCHDNYILSNLNISQLKEQYFLDLFGPPPGYNMYFL